MAESRLLTAQQERSTQFYLAGNPAAEAARKAGYSPTYSRKAAAFLLTQPAIKTAIDAAQGELRETTQYDLQASVRELDNFIVEARKDKSPNRMAIFKAVEMKARLHGLLIEKIDMRVQPVDLGGALIEARRRVWAPHPDAQDIEYTMAHAPAVTRFL